MLLEDTKQRTRCIRERIYPDAPIKAAHGDHTVGGNGLN